MTGEERYLSRWLAYFWHAGRLSDVSVAPNDHNPAAREAAERTFEHFEDAARGMLKAIHNGLAELEP